MKKVCAVVVTYNRKKMLKQNINHLLNQTYKLTKIIIIDNNSTDGTFEYIEDVLKDNKQIEYIKLPENLGGSGGFSKGIEHASKTNVDYIWGMDDDAFPEENALEKLMINIKSYDKNTCFWSNCDNDKIDFKKNLKEVDSWMFVGFLIPVTIIDLVGLPRDDFFIYHDDSEFAYRIRRRNIKIIKVKNSIIVHNNNNNNSDNNITKKVFNKNITIPKMPDWKMYYYIRNDILKYKWTDKKKYKRAFIKVPRFLIDVFLVNKKQLPIAIKGYKDGILGKSGKVVSP